jgi:hypothetical protein
MNMNQSLDVSRPNRESAEDPRELLGKPFLFQFWLRGGPPGQGFTSDKIEVKGDGHRIQGRFVRARFDPSYEPPFLAEEFSATLTNSQCIPLMRSFFQTNMMEKTHPSEQEPPVADILKETWELSWDGRHSRKTFFHELPSELEALRKLVWALAGDLEKDGVRKVLNRKR